MRRYLDGAGLIALLIGIGSSLTGIINAWVGFGSFLLAVGIAVYDLLQINKIKARFSKRLRLAILVTVILASILGLWKPMDDYVQTKERTIDARLTMQLRAGFDVFPFAILDRQHKLIEPIDVVLTVDITNTSPYPILITRCAAKFCGYFGSCKPMHRLRQLSREVAYVRGRKATQFVVKGMPIDYIEGKQIEARRHQEVSILLNYPPGVTDQDLNDNIVVSIAEEGGYIANIRLSPSKKVPESDIGWFTMTTVGAPIDLTAYTIKRRMSDWDEDR